MKDLTNEQIEGVVKLINDERHRNVENGDSAYNTFWENILTKYTQLKKGSSNE